MTPVRIHHQGRARNALQFGPQIKQTTTVASPVPTAEGIKRFSAIRAVPVNIFLLDISGKVVVCRGKFQTVEGFQGNVAETESAGSRQGLDFIRVSHSIVDPDHPAFALPRM